MLRFNTELIKTDVTSLKIYKHYLLAGIGAHLNIFDLNTNKIIKKEIIFDGLRIHGIEINPAGSHILLNAENELLVLKVSFDKIHFPEWITIQRRIETNDWILTTKWLQYNNFVMVNMHNTVEFFNDDLLSLDLKTCNTKCILYCASVCYNTIRDCVVLSGTVYCEILIWRPYLSCDVYHRLMGHQGVLFSIQYFDNHILSTSDDRSVILWKVNGNLHDKNCVISLKHKMHGHTARVFRCKILKNILLTVGEDGKICVWDYDGKLVKIFNVHHGGSVWALESDEHFNVIITGGSDSSIARLPIYDHSQSTKIKMFETEIPKKLCLLVNGDVIVITENGLLLHYNKRDENISIVATCKEFKRYALLEVSLCRKKFALAGFNGNVHVYSLINGLVVEYSRYQIANRNRIFAIHWLTCKHLLTCGPNGVLYLWKLQTCKSVTEILTRSLLLIGKYEIPRCKERWSTAACFIPNLGLAVGDRKGHLHYYSLDDSTPTHTVKRAHSHLGITHVYWNNDMKILTSLGRNSTLRTFQLNETSTKLIPLTSDVLPFAWLGMKLAHENSILGFSGNEMMLWDYEKRNELFSTNCGGGHRSWDADATTFIYIRDKAVNCLKITRPIELTSSMHATEINAMKCIKVNNKILLISGGEDTALRFSSCVIYDEQNKFKTKQLIHHQNIATIKSHLSSIRCLHLLNESNPVNCNLSKHCIYELISAGGRGQIIYWQLVLTESGDFVYCKELHSYEPRDEVRVMDLTSFIQNNEQLLFVACSDGTVKIYNLHNSMIYKFNTIIYKLRCILNICVVTLPNLKQHLLVTMATDGLVCFWNLNGFGKERTIDSPFFSYQAHSSGINAYDFRIINENTFFFITGGDDNKINLVVYKYDADCYFMDVIHHYENVESHSAQITGIYVSDHYFLTASLDQKLLRFDYEFGDELKVSYRISHSSTISDIKGLNVIEMSNEFYILLYGLGIELIKFNM